MRVSVRVNQQANTAVTQSEPRASLHYSGAHVFLFEEFSKRTTEQPHELSCCVQDFKRRYGTVLGDVGV